MGAYVTWVDAIALDKIGTSPVIFAWTNRSVNLVRLQILWCVHALGCDSVGSSLEV